MVSLLLSEHASALAAEYLVPIFLADLYDVVVPQGLEVVLAVHHYNDSNATTRQPPRNAHKSPFASLNYLFKLTNRSPLT